MMNDQTEIIEKLKSENQKLKKEIEELKTDRLKKYISENQSILMNLPKTDPYLVIVECRGEAVN